MAGILDFLQSPDAQLGIGLLAAGGPTTDPNQTGFGQRLAGAMNHVTANQQVALRAKLMQSQIDENASQNAMRQAQIARAAQLQGMTGEVLGGFGGSGAGGGQANGAGTAQPGAANPQAVAGLRGVPIEKIAALKAAGGPDLTDVWKLANVPTQFTAGSYAYTPGQRAEYLPDPTKGVGFNGQQITMLPGNENLASIEGQKAAAQAAWKPAQAYDSTKQQNFWTNDAALASGGRVGAPQGPAGYANEGQMRVTANGDMGADPKAIAREIKAVQNDLLTKKLDEPSRVALKAHLADLQSQGERIAAPQPANYAAGPSAQEVATNEANRTRAVNTAAADVVRDTANKGDAKKSAQMGEAAQLAAKLLSEGPTGSGIGALADAAGNFIGKPLKGATQAQQLEAISGWLTANIPRMEGPQSDADVRNYATMAGKIGDRTLPPEVRQAALSTLLELQGKYSALNGGTAAPSDSKPASKAPIPMKGMVQDGYKFKGGNAADPKSWEKI
jgi:hypothetical protein